MGLEELRSLRQERSLTKEERAIYCSLWEFSGLSKRSFCRQEGLARTTFTSWFSEREKSLCEEGKSEFFVPIKVSTTEPTKKELKALTFVFSSGLSVSGSFSLDELPIWLKELSDALVARHS